MKRIQRLALGSIFGGSLAAEGAPTLSLPAPFEAEPVWAGLAPGRVAFWDGESGYVRVSELNGGPEARLALPAGKVALSPADREAWFRKAIPVDELKGKQDIFAPLREKARTEVEFPETLPAVLAMQPDPDGSVWVRRTTSGSGELWVRLNADGRKASLRLPPGRELLAVGKSEVAVLARDENDVETVELYRKP
jgi:hypothetical protein